MKAIKETAMELLLNGEHINKSDFHAKYHTFTLTQRIEELRRDGWNIKSKTIPGRKGMVEYWLEPEEIARIKVASACKVPLKALEQDKEMNEQIEKNIENLRETAQKVAQNEKYEQMGLGLLGGHNY